MSYRLKAWSPELADELIAELENYPETLSERDRGRMDSGYFYAFHYASLGQEEALYRFPNAEQARQWRLDYAYNLAQSGDNRASIVYAIILADLLNNREITLDDLKTGFEEIEPRIRLEPTLLNPIRDHTSDYLVYLGIKSDWRDGMAAGACFWLFEKKGVYVVYPLTGDVDFRIPHAEGVGLVASDLTGDGIPEAVVEQDQYPGVMMETVYLRVYRLDQEPPVEIEFNPPLEATTVMGWSKPDEEFGLTITTTRKMDYCIGWAQGFSREYRWDGTDFYLETMRILPDNEFAGNIYCYFDWLHTLFDEMVSGNKAAIRLAPELVANDPIQSRLDEYLSHSEVASYDGIRFLQGIMLYLSGHVDLAKVKLQDIVDHPTDRYTDWAGAASRFLKTLQTSGDYLDACLASGMCNRIMYLNDLIKFIPVSKFPKIVDILTSAGIPVWDHGVYDFNADGQDEIWIVYSYSAEYSVNKELAILYIEDDHIGIEIGSMETGVKIAALEIIPAPNWDNRKVHHLFLGNWEFTLFSQANADSQVPNFVFYLGWPYDILAGIQSELFTNSNPTEISKRLEEYRASLLVTDHNLYKTSLYHLYLQALAHELSGETDEAVQAYLQLWQSYPDSPYAIMARAKLEPVP